MSDSKRDKDNKKGFNLGQVEKKHIYRTPDKYFDELPGIIQSRVVKKMPFYQTNAFRTGFKYAFPVVCLLVIGIYIGFFSGQHQQAQTFESLIADVSYEDLAAYLEDSDISTEEIIAGIEDQGFFIEFEHGEVDPLHGFELEGENIDELIEELDTDGTYF